MSPLAVYAVWVLITIPTVILLVRLDRWLDSLADDADLEDRIRESIGGDDD